MVSEEKSARMDHSLEIKLKRSQQLAPADKVNDFLSKFWFPLVIILLGLYVGLPFLAPIFMNIGWTGPGKLIYWIYSYLCHQMAQRSFFLFGPNITYTFAQLQSAGVDITSLLNLHEFIGNSEMGWKVAWSDRMVSMYTSMLLVALIWYPVRKRVVKLPWWGFVLFLLPMAIDGTTHFISDLAGLGQGFRDNNEWLAVLTQNRLPTAFYVGDTLGSFNSWMRLITGVLFGIGVIWFSFPFLEKVFLAPAQLRKLRTDSDRELLERLLKNADKNPS